MENRINRKDDESLYQPKIPSDRIRSLYRLKQETGKPMTVLLDQAIQDFEASYGDQNPLSDQSFLRNEIKRPGRRFANTEGFLMIWNIKSVWRS